MQVKADRDKFLSFLLEKKITPWQVAEMSVVSTNTLTRIMKNKPVQLKTIYKLAEFMHVSPTEIVEKGD